MKINIMIKTQFEATHCWVSCPEDYPKGFLRNEHRHMFHVKLKMAVTHSDRQIEFLALKDKLNIYLNEKFSGSLLLNGSCEMIAKKIGDWAQQHGSVVKVEVWEDDENGAEVVYE